MSFALTTEQVRNRTKTVTRRLGWTFAKVGDVVQPVLKSQGLKKGETVQKVGCPIRFVRVTRERLDVIDNEEYGSDEAKREGFPEMTGYEFVTMFCEHNGCNSDTDVTRIEFEYLDPPSGRVEGTPRSRQEAEP